MKKTIFIFILALSSISIFAQTPDWAIIPVDGYDSQDVGVATYIATEHGVVTDVLTNITEINKNTQAVQTLLNNIANLGGGVLYFPAGTYYLNKFSIPKGVSIRGVWKTPTNTKSVDGTVLACKSGRNTTFVTDAFITMEPSTSVTNLAIWYPDQDPNNVSRFPPSIMFGKNSYWGNEYCHVRNVTFVNSYHAVLHNGGNGGGATNVHNVYGTVFNRGLELDNVSEVCRWDYVRWSPKYWAASGLPGAPSSTSAPYAEFMKNNAIGAVQKRNDWSYTSFYEAEGLNIGFHAVKSVFADNNGGYPTPNGHNYGFIFNDCGTGILCDNISSYGIMFSNVTTENCGRGLVVNSTDNAPVQINNCTFDADTAVWLSKNARSRLMMYQTTINRGRVVIESSDFSSVAGDYNNAAPQIELLKDCRAIITGNSSSLGEVDIKNCSFYECHIDHTPITNAKTPPVFAWEDCFDVPTKPAQNDLRVVTNAPYNARPFRVLPHGTYTLTSNPFADEAPNTVSFQDNSPANRKLIRNAYLDVMNNAQDATAIIQNAINDVAGLGGGIVYLPAGHYKVLGTLTIKTGVELKGANDVGTHPMGIGTVLLAFAGQASDTPFISMEANSGIRGITIDYPNQDAFESENYKKVYSYTIRGNANTYIVNVALHACYQGVDLFTNACHNHFIDYLAGQPFKNTVRVGNGSTGGRIYNIQTNLISYVSGNENKFGTWINSPLRDGGAPTDAIKSNVQAYISEQHDFMILGDCSNQILYNNFGYLAHHGLWFKNEGSGPSGKSLGQGVDAGIISLYYEKLGDGGFPLLNSQIVVVQNGSSANRAKTAYIQTTTDFTGEANIFSSDYWGNPQVGVVAGGGTLNLYTAHSNAQLRNIKQESNGIVNFYNSNIGNMSINGDASKVSAAYSVVRLPNGVNTSSVYNLDPTTKNPNENSPIKDRTGWVAYASENNGAKAQESIDGNTNTYWISVSNQNSSLWYYVDMNKQERFNLIYFSAGTGSNYISRFDVLISNDGENWVRKIATNTSGSRQVILELPYTYEARYIKIQSTGSSANKWAIYEFGISEECICNIPDYVPNPNPTVLDKTGWIAYASENESGIVQMSIDESYNSYWVSTSNQSENQWYYVDMQEQNKFNSIVINSGNNNFHINKFNVLISDDGEIWTQIADGISGSGDQTILNLPHTYQAQYIKIQSTSATNNKWAIFEFGVGYDETVGIINNYADDIQISVYYENGTLFIDGIEKYPAKIAIYNIIGQQLINKTITSNAVHIGELKTGVYILTINQNNKYFNGKFLVK